MRKDECDEKDWETKADMVRPLHAMPEVWEVLEGRLRGGRPTHGPGPIKLKVSV